jgi:hypothetical protein
MILACEIKACSTARGVRDFEQIIQKDTWPHFST